MNKKVKIIPIKDIIKNSLIQKLILPKSNLENILKKYKNK